MRLPPFGFAQGRLAALLAMTERISNPDRYLQDKQGMPNNECKRGFGVDGLKNFGYCVVGLKAECCTMERLGCNAGFPAGTPDERVLAFLELCGEINLRMESQ